MGSGMEKDACQDASRSRGLGAGVKRMEREEGEGKERQKQPSPLAMNLKNVPKWEHSEVPTRL